MSTVSTVETVTLLDDPRPISADSHALEGPEVFDGLADRFGDDAPRVVHRDGQGDFIVVPNMPKRSRNVAVMALAGTRLDYATPLPREHASKPGTGSLTDPEVQAYFTGGYAAMRPGLTDGARRPDDPTTKTSMVLPLRFCIRAGSPCSA